MKSNAFFIVGCFLFMGAVNNLYPSSCQSDFTYKILKANNNEGDSLGALLLKMKISQSDVQKIIADYTVENGEKDSTNDIFPYGYDIRDSESNLKFRILSTGFSWDHFYLVFRKSKEGWKYLKTLSGSQMDPLKGIKFFTYQGHSFLALSNVQNHGCCPWYAIANCDLYLMDKDMEQVGDLISYGNPEGAIMGKMSYETMMIKGSDQNDCFLEQDLKINCDAFYGSSATNGKEKYEFDDFKAFSKVFKLFYKWDEASKKFVFIPDKSDFKTNPIETFSDGLDEDQFLNFFYPEIEKIAEKKDKNKNIWLMSTLDFVKGKYPDSLKLKNNLLKIMNQN